MEEQLIQTYAGEGLSLDMVRRQVPSIFATAPRGDVSDKYSFIPTLPIIEAIMDRGWKITKAQAQVSGRGKKITCKEHGAHMLRFSNDQELTPDDPSKLEIILINSHDRTRTFKLLAGVFRLVCSNGMIIAESKLGMSSIVHRSLSQSIADIIDGSTKIADHADEISKWIGHMRARELTQTEQLDFARHAIDIRYRGSQTTLPPETVLLARRENDENASLWTTYNRIQENIIKGGLSTGKRHTRPVASLAEDLTINTALWKTAKAYLN